MKTILTILPDLNMGGAQHMVYELIKNMDNNLYRNVVICYGPRMNTPLEKQMEKICRVIYLGIDKRITIKYMMKVLKAIWREKPNVIHAHMGGITFAIPYSKIVRIPVVLTVHTKPEKAFSERNEKAIRNYLSSNKMVIVAVSKENCEYVKQYFNNRSNCVYINNGVDIHKYQQKIHEEFTYINVATQDENKNQKVIVKAFDKACKSISNIRLLLLGDGPCHKELLDMISELGLSEKIEIPGMIAEPMSYYNRSDVYIQSSHREAMPLAVLEAMAAGLPILSTNVGGMCDVVKENGFLINDDDDIVNSLAIQMINMHNMPKEIFERMRCSSQDIVKAFSSEEMAQNYSAIYKKVIKKKW